MIYAIERLFDSVEEKAIEKGIGERSGAITFLEPIEKDQSKLLDFSGIWDEEDVNDIEAVIRERSNFSKGRDYEI